MTVHRPLRRSAGTDRTVHALVLVPALFLSLLVASSPAAAPAVAAGAASVTASAGIADRTDWIWPLATFRIVRAYAAPAHEYGPGHRGIDLAPPSPAPVRAPEAGVVAFRGSVAGRPLITIDHGDGLVTTLEPVASDLAAGAAVARGQEVGVVDAGGHAVVGAVHFGVRLDGEYINPMLLLGGIPRAVLLPCCS